MKLIGKNSLLYWLRIPFAIYTLGFILSSVWIVSLALYHIITGEKNQYITNSIVEKFKYDDEDNFEKSVELINFKYPFSQMVMQTENNTLSIIMAIVGILSVCFILSGILYFVHNLSKETIFNKKTVHSLNILGLGLILLGLIHIIVEYIDKSHHYGVETPLLAILVGFIILLIKEIFVKGQRIQEENDLTI